MVGNRNWMIFRSPEAREAEETAGFAFASNYFRGCPCLELFSRNTVRLGRSLRDTLYFEGAKDMRELSNDNLKDFPLR